MKKFFLALLCAVALPAFAQSTSTSSTMAETGAVQNNGNPVLNFNTAAPSAVTSSTGTTDFRTNQAQSPATVFVNGPSNDTCALPGDGLSIQIAGGGIGGSKGGGTSVTCEARADALNLKGLGASPAVVKARQCMNPAMEEAFARAGEPCLDARPKKVAASPTVEQLAVVTRDPYIAARLGGGYASK